MAVARVEDKDGQWRVAVQSGDVTKYLSPAEVLAVFRLEVPRVEN